MGYDIPRLDKLFCDVGAVDYRIEIGVKLFLRTMEHCNRRSTALHRLASLGHAC